MKESKIWKRAMEEEIESLKKNEIQYLVTSSNGIKPIGSKWVFNKRLNATSQAQKCKALLVSKGYSQFKEVDSNKFSHMLLN